MKWLGYASAENTWELPTNIRRDILDSFEQTQLTGTSTSDGKRSRLRYRSTRRVTNKPDYIVNQ